MKKTIKIQLIIFITISLSLWFAKKPPYYEQVFPFNWAFRLTPTLQEKDVIELKNILNNKYYIYNGKYYKDSFYCYSDDYSGKCYFYKSKQRHISLRYKDIAQCEYGYYKATYDIETNQALCFEIYIGKEDYHKGHKKPKTLYYAPWGAEVTYID